MTAAGLAAALGMCPLAAQALPQGAQNVPMEIQDAVEAALAHFMVQPQMSKWTFDFMVDDGGQKLVCGTVNFQSAMHTYVGAKRFYAFLKDGKVMQYQLQDPAFLDTTGAEARDFHRLCDRP